MAEWRPPIFAPFESIFGEKVQSFFSVRWIFPRCLFPFSASCRADAVNSHLSIFPASIRYPSRDNTPDIDMSKRFTAFVYFVPVCTPFSPPTRNIHTYTHTVDLFPTLKAACPLSREGKGWEGSLCCEDHFSRITWNDLHDDVNVAVNLGRGMKQFQILLLPSPLSSYKLCANVSEESFHLFVPTFQ